MVEHVTCRAALYARKVSGSNQTLRVTQKPSIIQALLLERWIIWRFCGAYKPATGSTNTTVFTTPSRWN
jgi:hypothetical protein